MKALDSMRRDWNERARHNAFLYIASWRRDWTEESFFASGEADVQRLVNPILARLALNPANCSMAELGCGAGRMTRAFARQFQSATPRNFLKTSPTSTGSSLTVSLFPASSLLHSTLSSVIWSSNTIPPLISSLPPFVRCSAFFVRMAFSSSISTGAIGPQ